MTNGFPSRVLAVTLFAIVCAVLLPAAQTPESPEVSRLIAMMVGTWKVNLERSTYHPGPAPAMGPVARWEKLPNGFRQTGLRPDGQPQEGSFVGYFDGKDYPDRDPAGAYDSTEMTIVDDHSFIFTRKKAGRAVQMASRVYSADGKTSTLTVIGRDASDRAFTRVTVWDKQ